MKVGLIDSKRPQFFLDPLTPHCCEHISGNLGAGPVLILSLRSFCAVSGRQQLLRTRQGGLAQPNFFPLSPTA